MPSSLSARSANITKDKNLEWFAALRNYIEKINGGCYALRDPKQVFNCDESGFPHLVHQSGSQNESGSWNKRGETCQQERCRLLAGI